MLFDERQLANLGLDVSTLVDRLAQENVNVTGGQLRDGQTEYMVRTVGELERPEQLREVVIDAGRGAIVRLDDVAEVRRGFQEREIITRIDGRESVEVAIYKAGGTNTVKVSDSVREGLEDVRQQLNRLDPGLEVTVITDQARYIRRSVSEVLQTALLGGLLAVIVLYLFLRSWQATAIIAGAIPVSVVGNLLPDVPVGHLAQHHVPGRPHPRDRAVGRQRHRRSGIDPAPAGRRQDRDRGRGDRRRPGGDRHHGVDPDLDLRLSAHRLRRRGGRRSSSPIKP